MYMSVKAGAQPAMHMPMPMCAVSTRSIRLIDENSFSKVSVCSGGERVVGFRDEHAFADGHRRVRNGALDVRRARNRRSEQVTVFGRDPSLPQWTRRMMLWLRQRAGDRCDDRFQSGTV